MRNLLSLALGLILLPLAVSHADVLFAGGEDLSFTAVGTVTYGGNTNSFRSGFARVNFAVNNSTSTSDPPSNRAQSPTFTSSCTDCWIHGRFWDATATGTSGEQGIIVRSPDGVGRILVRQTGTTGVLKVSTRTAGGTITDLATASGAYVTGAGSASTINVLDLHINYTCSGAGGVDLWLNGVRVINYSGNPCTDSATDLNQADLAALSNASSANCGSSGGTCWSEIIATDQDTRGMALRILNPQAAGNTQDCSGSVGNINKTTIDDTSVISTGSTSALCEFTVPTTNPLSGAVWNVTAIVQEARALVGTTGPQTFKFALRTGGSDFVSGALSPTTSFTNFNGQIWQTNPDTSSAWSYSEITDAGFNLGVKSNP